MSLGEKYAPWMSPGLTGSSSLFAGEGVWMGFVASSPPLEFFVLDHASASNEVEIYVTVTHRCHFLFP